jgi:hypothetical protein
MHSESAASTLQQLRRPDNFHRYESGRLAARLDKSHVCLELSENLRDVFVCSMVSDSWHNGFESVALAILNNKAHQHLVRLAMTQVYYAELRPKGLMKNVCIIYFFDFLFTFR